MTPQAWKFTGTIAPPEHPRYFWHLADTIISIPDALSNTYDIKVYWYMSMVSIHFEKGEQLN